MENQQILINQLKECRHYFKLKTDVLTTFSFISNELLSASLKYRETLSLLKRKIKKIITKVHTKYEKPFVLIHDIINGYKKNLDEFNNFIKDGIIISIKNYTEDANRKETEYFNNIIKIQEEYYSSLKKEKLAMASYNEELFKTEQIVLNDEINKQKGQDISDIEEMSGLGDAINVLDSKDAKRKYQAAVTETKKKCKEFSILIPMNFKEYEKYNSQMDLLFKSQIDKFVQIFHDKATNDINVLTKCKDKIEKLNEITKEENISRYQITIPKKSEFHPYQLEILKGKKIDATIKLCKFYDRLTYNVVKQMKKTFKEVSPDYDIKEEEKKLLMIELCNNILTNKEIEHKDLSLLSQKNYRLHFLMYLNFKRAEGKFTLSKRSFINLGTIMKQLVSIIENEIDYETLRFCLILSQTFYFVNHRGEKFYVIRYFDNNPLFKTKEFWDFFIVKSIDQDKEKQKENMQKVSEKDEERQNKNIIFTKILSTAHNMMEFGIEKEKINEYIHYFSEKYKIDKDVEDSILLMMKELSFAPKTPFDELRDIVDESEVNTILQSKDDK